MATFTEQTTGSSTVAAAGAVVVDELTVTATAVEPSRVEPDGSVTVDELTVTATAVEPSRVEPDGFPIPAGSFRWVEVEIVDPKGDPIPAAEYIASGELFPVKSAVETRPDGTTYAPRTYLLDRSYNELVLTAVEDGVVYEWKEPEENRDETSVAREQNAATVVFEPTPKRGLPVTGQTSEGGNLSV